MRTSNLSFWSKFGNSPEFMLMFIDGLAFKIQIQSVFKHQISYHIQINHVALSYAIRSYKFYYQLTFTVLDGLLSSLLPLVTTYIPQSFTMFLAAFFSFFSLQTLPINRGSTPSFFFFWFYWQVGYLHSGFIAILQELKKSLWALYERQYESEPKLSKNFNVAWDKNPAIIPIVVGKLAAHTPYRLIVSSVPQDTAKGLAQPKHPNSPGTRTCICPERALQETPDQNHIWLTLLQIALTVILALQLSTQLSTKSIGPYKRLPFSILSLTCSYPSWVVIFISYASITISGLMAERVCLAASTFDEPIWEGVKKSLFMLASSTLSQSQMMSLPIPHLVNISEVTDPIPPTPTISTLFCLISYFKLTLLHSSRLSPSF